MLRTTTEQQRLDSMVEHTSVGVRKQREREEERNQQAEQAKMSKVEGKNNSGKPREGQ